MNNKTLLTSIFLLIIPVLFLYSQDIERITYMELRPDGSRGATKTVDAFFFSWIDTEYKVEGNLLTIHQNSFINGKWSGWVLTSKEPMIGTLGRLYASFVREYTSFPNTGGIYPFDEEFSALKMMDIPRGSAMPMRWGTDGTSFFVLYKMYVVIK